MKDKYEISLWEDFPDTNGQEVSFLNERKLCVIGSDTMTSQSRAIEPKMVSNINGTNTFTFKMYYRYIDNITGEDVINPFGSLLINERKVKVLWKNVWYDMIITSLDEDTATRTITYTCKDLFISELSKNGYELEFSTDLQNNTGTASELARKVLENTGWNFDITNSSKLEQRVEEPVYLVQLEHDFTAAQATLDGDIEGYEFRQLDYILIYYSQIINLSSNELVKIQFYYGNDVGNVVNETEEIEEHDMLVTNGNCYVAEFNVYKNNSTGVFEFQQNSNTIFYLNPKDVSSEYRAERWVDSQKTVYDKLLDRYVNVYTDSSNGDEVYGYETTEFTDPLAVVNLIANPTNFTNTEGWALTSSNQSIGWKIYPRFDSSTDLDDYETTSYLVITRSNGNNESAYIYNAAINSNMQYLKPSTGDIKNGFLYSILLIVILILVQEQFQMVGYIIK